MKVFSLYKKLFRSYLIVVIIYVVIFLGLSIILSSSQGQSNSAYTETIVNVTLDNLDEGSSLSEGLVEYLSNFVYYKDIKDEDRKDALYFRQIYAIITIPTNFEADYIEGRDVRIAQERIEQNASSVAIDRAIDKYLNYIRVYSNQTNKSLDEIIVLVNEVLEEEVQATTLVKENDQLASSAAFYRVFSYIAISTILIVVGNITISFRRLDVRRRLLVSPYPTKKANLDMIFGNLLFTIAVNVLLCGISLFLYPEVMFTKNGLLLIINAFLFSFAALSISYFMCLLVRNEQVLAGVNNVYSMGSAFLSGAFVPQFLLSEGILAFAHILPSYYYVYNVELITSNISLSNVNINKFILYMFIQALFAIAFIVFTIILSKKQARSEE